MRCFNKTIILILLSISPSSYAENFDGLGNHVGDVLRDKAKEAYDKSDNDKATHQEKKQSHEEYMRYFLKYREELEKINTSRENQDKTSETKRSQEKDLPK